MTQPSDAEGGAAAYYDEFSRRYDAERQSGYFGFINELELDKILPLAAGKKVLEVGCGTGLLLQRVVQVAAEAIGIDLSEGMVAGCRAKGLDARQASVTELPFEDDSFDVVYSAKVLAHVPEIVKALGETARVTRPGGRMVLEFYNPWSTKGLNDRLRGLIRGRGPVYIRYDTLRKVRSYLPAGTEVLSTRGVRIFGLLSCCYTLPVVGGLTRALDRLACDGPLRALGGYYLVELGLQEARE